MVSKKRLLQLPQETNFFLFGPRQVGKSTLLKESFASSTTLYINLLINKVFRKYAAEPSTLGAELDALDSKISHVVIDEIQKVPELLDEVHNQIENASIKRYFALSGSSARKLKRGQANLLGGRAWTRYLYPLSYLELQNDFDLARVLLLGTLPSVYLFEDDIAIETLDAYVDTYLTEEIKAEAIVRNIGAFSRFLKLAAAESSNLLNYSNIAREAATSYKTIKEYFQILEDTLLGFHLLPYDRSDRKRLVKHPKFYFFDNGVRNALLNRLSNPIEPSTYEFGIAFEHFIINEVIKINHYFKKKLDLYFYRTNSGAEVDLIIESPQGKTLAVEIKSSTNPSKSDVKGLYSFREIRPEAKLICVSRIDLAKKIDEIEFLAWQQFLQELTEL